MPVAVTGLFVYCILSLTLSFAKHMPLWQCAGGRGNIVLRYS